MKVVNASVAAVLLLWSSLSDAGRSINADAIIKEERDDRIVSLRGRVADVKLVRENEYSIVLEVM